MLQKFQGRGRNGGGDEISFMNLITVFGISLNQDLKTNSSWNVKIVLKAQQTRNSDYQKEMIQSSRIKHIKAQKNYI